MLISAEYVMLAAATVGIVGGAASTIRDSVNRGAENVAAAIERPTERIPVMPKLHKCDCGCGRANCECGGECDD